MAVEIRPKTGSLAVKVERNDHTTLTHRNESNQHEISAISGLTEALANLNNYIDEVKNNVNSNDSATTDSIKELSTSIELLAINLTDLINNLVDTERERALVKEEALDDKFTGEISILKTNTEREIKRIDQNVISLGNELSARVNELQAVEHELHTKITEENIRATEAEETLELKIDEETARAQLGEEKLHDLLNVETNRAINQEKVLTQNIDAEIKRATVVEEELDKKISEN